MVLIIYKTYFNYKFIWCIVIKILSNTFVDCFCQACFASLSSTCHGVAIPYRSSFFLLIKALKKQASWLFLFLIIISGNYLIKVHFFKIETIKIILNENFNIHIVMETIDLLLLILILYQLVRKKNHTELTLVISCTKYFTMLSLMLTINLYFLWSLL